ncbi:hypothetical protein KAR10_04665 [bacterium]|nr:hypothetical protein [bacterium]
MLDTEEIHCNVRQTNSRPNQEGQYSRKLKDIMGKVIPETEAREVYQEILTHKWVQTENLVNKGELRYGSSLTLKQAAEEWMHRHYPAWETAHSSRPEITKKKKLTVTSGSSKRKQKQ